MGTAVRVKGQAAGPGAGAAWSGRDSGGDGPGVYTVAGRGGPRRRGRRCDRCSHDGAVVWRIDRRSHPHRTHSSRHTFRASRRHTGRADTRSRCAVADAHWTSTCPPISRNAPLSPSLATFRSSDVHFSSEEADTAWEEESRWINHVFSAGWETACRSRFPTAGSAPASSGIAERAPCRETTAEPGSRFVTRRPRRGGSPRGQQ